MSKPIKDLITREYQRRYTDVDSACLVSVIGMDAISTNQLRGDLQSRKIRLQVVKNSLVRRAFAGGPLAPLAAATEGPCAVVTGEESIVDIAKMLVRLQKTYPKLALKVGILGGGPTLIEIERLAKMKSRQELIAEIAMLVESPGRSLAGALASPGRAIAACLKTLAERPGSDA